MRLTGLLLAVLAVSGCGDSLVEHWDAGAGTDGGTTGLACAADDPCTCTPCTDTQECALGLSCVTAKRHGANCNDNRKVCTTP